MDTPAQQLKTARQHLARQDEVLARIMEAVGLDVQPSSQNLFHDLMSCVIEQQIHYRSTKKQFAKLLALAGLDSLHPDNFDAFAEKALASAKLSERKFETMQRVLDHFEAGVPDWQALSDEEVRRQLSSIKGVGAWTIDMLLLYTLERPDIFPADDFHLQQLMPGLYGFAGAPRQKAEMKRIAAIWAPHRSTATRYLLAWKTAQKAGAL